VLPLKRVTCGVKIASFLAKNASFRQQTLG
jgi:hypothetical protein